MSQRVARSTRNQDPVWYKDAIIYELHVRAFADSNDDGIGDFCGLTSKLDYLQDLGVTALWLLPFYPSPLQDDGYDIADYTDVHPSYGTLRDFKAFLKAAHARGLKVITELVLNHTSAQHPWFQRARRARPGSPWRDFYVWSDTPERYRDARIIFQDFEGSNWTWDPVANAYYWHRFYAHQPDLNYANPRVRAAIRRVVDFWLRLGVDGLRLDAVPYLFEREGTTGENLPETHAALRRLRRHIDEHFPARMLLAEANQWPEDAVAYFGQGDECHMAFHFPLMPRLFMAIRREDRFPILDILAQTPPIPDTAQWALFLRNHDELTLEMVTDTERVYMYRTYARDEAARINLGIRRRLAPLLHNNRRKIELLHGLLCSLPGTPVLYYGDEIGMGDNVFLGDRNGVRTPMQWSADRNAGFSRANPQQLYLPLIVDHEYHHETIHVEAQQSNPSSLLSWMKRLLALRKRYPVFGRGQITFLRPDNRKVLAFLRHDEQTAILVVANLSRFLQHVELDLAAFADRCPVELFGRTTFPALGEQPYPLTLAPHAFCWFALEPQPAARPATAEDEEIPTITWDGAWEDLVRGDGRTALEDVLPAYLVARNWFFGKHRTILGTSVQERIPIPVGDRKAYLTIVRVQYADDESQTYLVPLACLSGGEARRLVSRSAHAVVARLRDTSGGDQGVLYDAMWDEAFAAALLDTVVHGRHYQGLTGTTTVTPRPKLRRRRRATTTGPSITTLHATHNNTAIVYGDELILKLIRCLDDGVNPELEIGAFLTEHRFPHSPAMLGALAYHQNQHEPTTLAILQPFIPNHGELWETMQTQLREYLGRAAHRSSVADDGPVTAAALLALADQQPPTDVRELIGPFLDRVRLLGQRTAELHLALASDPEDADFAPQPFTPLYQRALYQSFRSVVSEVFDDLRRRQPDLPTSLHTDIRALLDGEQRLLERLKAVTARKIDAVRIRCHGDYHLGQVLDTGDDVVIFDFEGESRRPVLERRLKRAAFEDLAGMLRSLYAATTTGLEHKRERARGQSQQARLDGQARCWVRWVSAAFLQGYLHSAGAAPFVPQARADQILLLDGLLIEKALDALARTLDEHPERVPGALQQLRAVLGTEIDQAALRDPSHDATVA
ncbi:MAG TPA: maltose alpha-D-glucosyltransferase [Herpetosiphonaceae bacterium]